jgi:arginine:agmatine antiporter
MSRTGTFPLAARHGGRKLGRGLAALVVAGNRIGPVVCLTPVALAATGSSSLTIWYARQIGGLNDFAVGFDPAATAL